MTVFQMVKYHGQTYPDHIPLNYEEVTGTFDSVAATSTLGMSLHTEYSFDSREFSTPLVTRFPEIIAANKRGIPQLWKNPTWASQFADFVFALIGEGLPPKIIEVHPPFSDYTDLDGFIASYSVFEAKIKACFPETQILLENRCGSRYGKSFLVSKFEDVVTVKRKIEMNRLALRLAFDVPQIFTAEQADDSKAYTALLEQASTIKDFIEGVHLWGKKETKSGRRVSHCGDLNTYFKDPAAKQEFLTEFVRCFDDGKIRKMVLEVNSGNDDLRSILSDLEAAGVRFV